MTTEIEAAYTAPEELHKAEELKRYAAEKRQVQGWLERVSKAKDFDEAALAQYQADRKIARGDAGNFEVYVNLIAGYIDVLNSFLYAKDPDVDVVPAAQVVAPKEQPPKRPDLPPPPPPSGDPMLDQQLAMQHEAQFGPVALQYSQQVQRYNAAQQAKSLRAYELDLLCQTLEILISKLWGMAKLKNRARLLVRSGLTVGIGWLKQSWQEHETRDPVIASKIGDIETRIERIEAMTRKLADENSSTSDLEAERAQLEQEKAALAEQGRIVTHRGLVIDYIPADHIQVAPGVQLTQYEDAPWIAHKVFMAMDDALAAFPDVKPEKLKKAASYGHKKPVIDDSRELPRGGAGRYDSTQDDYVKDAEGDCICVVEIWHKDSGLVLTTAEGLDCWLKPPSPPNVITSMFYPFVCFAPLDVDGERHPQSNVQRSARAHTEFNRILNALRNMRKRSMPGVLFNKSELDPSEIKQLVSGVEQEYIGLKTVSPDVPLSSVFSAKPVSPIDPMVYDLSGYYRILEDIWGVQQALMGGITQAKTATEADIQQTGTQSRLNSFRDKIETCLTQLAQMAAEIVVAKMERADVERLVGPDAMWPDFLDEEHLQALVDVQIRAGTTGKPNTMAEREAWATNLPLLQEMVMQVGQMRNSAPSEIADKLEALAGETLKRTGERMDVTRFIPQGEGLQENPAPPPAPPAPQGAPDMQQMVQAAMGGQPPQLPPM